MYSFEFLHIVVPKYIFLSQFGSMNENEHFSCNFT